MKDELKTGTYKAMLKEKILKMRSMKLLTVWKKRSAQGWHFVIANRIIRHLEIPVPSLPANNEYLVTIPLQTSLKASIWLAMQEKNLNQTELAKALSVQEKEVRKILDPRHNTKLETLERSLIALGKRLVLYVA